jgi:hypothetical protein
MTKLFRIGIESLGAITVMHLIAARERSALKSLMMVLILGIGFVA